MPRQRGQVVEPIAEGRDLHDAHRQPLVEVGAEAVRGHQELQRLAGGGHEADVDGHRGLGADGADHALLHGAEQLGLHLQGHGADLVQEQRAAVRLAEGAAAIADGAREGEQ